MAYPWLGVILSGLGMVASAVLWFFTVTSVIDGLPPRCMNSMGFQVQCEVGGIDMRLPGVLSVVVLAASIALAVISIRAGRRPRRRPPSHTSS